MRTVRTFSPAFMLQHRVFRKYPYNKNEIAIKLLCFVIIFKLPRPYHYYIRFYKWAKIDEKKLKFATWFFSQFPGRYCWADCVSWAFSPRRFNPFKIDGSKGCEIESKEHEHQSCYCGNWFEGKCWDKLSATEQKDYRDKWEKEREEHYKNSVDDLPF